MTAHDTLRILLTRRWPEPVEAQLLDWAKEAKRIEVVFNSDDAPLTRRQLASALADFDVICPTVTDGFSADMLANVAPLRCKLLANFGVGVNHIDLAAAQSHGIAVTNTPGVLTDATAEIALTLILMSARRAGEGERYVRAGKWDGWGPTHMLSTQVTGKTLGIVGMGRIGIALARKAHHGLGMNVLYYSRSTLAAEITTELDARQVALDTLLSSSDFVSLHCPSTDATRHLIDANALATMPKHAHLINTARGDVVDEAALVDALETGAIGGAGLDVYTDEPRLPEGLDRLENVVLLPHMGSGTIETRIDMGMCAFQNVRKFVGGEPLPNQIDTV